jgi:CDP-paratose 2-epimerase
MADQGWAAFLVQETKQDRVVGLNGKGKQVRDLLDVEDLVELIIRAVRQKVINNRVYNIGGGPDRALSLLELFQNLRERGYDPKYEFGQLRPSDQLYYVSDIQTAISDFGWTPKYNLDEIIDRLIDSC